MRRILGAAAALVMVGGVVSSAGALQRIEAVDRTALRVCADPAATPLSSQDGKGIENRVAELLAGKLGVPVRYTWFPSGIGFYRRTLNVRRCDIVMGTVAGNDIAATTIPYYRSTYVLVTRAADRLSPGRLDDAALKGKRVGVQAGTPGATLAMRGGLADTMRSYDLMVDSRLDSVGRRMVDDVDGGTIDAAVVWGPVATYFAGLKPGRFAVTPLTGDKDVPLAYDIAMAVRMGEPGWRNQINGLIRANRREIAAILTAARVPLLPMTEEKP